MSTIPHSARSVSDIALTDDDARAGQQKFPLAPAPDIDFPDFAALAIALAPGGA